MPATAINGTEYEFGFEYQTPKRKAWKTAKLAHVNAATANKALRAAGFKDARKSPRVKVVTGHRTGRRYRAVKVF